MNLKYKILWFEDDDEVIKVDVGPHVESFLIELGFQLEVIHRLNGEELNNLIKDRDIDLIVTDLNLGEFETGEILIDHIRDGLILTEVLLYSANASEINNIVDNKGWIERASFSVGLANLTEKLKSIISLTIKKNQDVNNTRGLVIAETIDLEKKIEKILLKFFQASNEIVGDDIKEGLRKSIYNKKLEKHQKDIVYIEEIKLNEIKDLIDKDILTANNSYETVASIIKHKIKRINADLNSGNLATEKKEALTSQKKYFDSIQEEFIKFKGEIIDIRNVLAHVEENIDENGIPYLKSTLKGMEAIRFNNEKYIEIRKSLRKHSNNLDLIFEHIL